MEGWCRAQAFVHPHNKDFELPHQPGVDSSNLDFITSVAALAVSGGPGKTPLVSSSYFQHPMHSPLRPLIIFVPLPRNSPPSFACRQRDFRWPRPAVLLPMCSHYLCAYHNRSATDSSECFLAIHSNARTQNCHRTGEGLLSIQHVEGPRGVHIHACPAPRGAAVCFDPAWLEGISYFETSLPKQK